MLWIFWIVVALIGMVLIPNALYAIRHYMTTRDRLWLLTYVSFLSMLGFILFRLTFSAISFVQVSRETMAGPDIAE